MTITGTNLGGATSVKFGAAPAASFTVDSDTEITATTPSSVKSGGGTAANSAT